MWKTILGKPRKNAKEPFIPLNEGTLYGAGALKKIFLPSSRQTRPPSPVHLRRRGMPACPAYPVIRNNAAPFLFPTIPIPSVHDAGWHVRVYEASRTVKKVPRRLRESTHELWRTAASGYEQWQLINYINLYNTPTSVRPLQRHLIFLPIPKAKKPAGSGKKRESSRKGFRHARRNYTLPFLPIPEKHGLTRACRLRNAWTICMIDHPLRIYPLLHKLQCRH